MREFPARSAAQPTAQVKDAPADFEAHKKTVLEVLLAAPGTTKGIVKTRVQKTLGDGYRWQPFEDAWKAAPQDLKHRVGKPSKTSG
jgi:tripartite-type tricarboxylate transporter receptor subunit TctC